MNGLQSRQKNKLNVLLSILLMMTLSGCSLKKPPTNVNVRPKASASFIVCALDEYKARRYGDCTKQIVTDWAKEVN